MIASALMGLVAGARSMTPLATVACLARRRDLPNAGPLSRLLGSGWVAAGATALAVGELLGDKMRTAPDRTVAPGRAARILTGGIAGAALTGERDEVPGALVGAVAAVASSYVTLSARKRAMRRFGQRPTGLVEDALVVGCALWIASRARR